MKKFLGAFHGAGFLPWLAGGMALVLYLATLCPAVWWISSGEFIASGEVLGIPHAPGASPYVLLGRLFALFFPTCPEWGINLISALSAAFAVGATVKLSAPDSKTGKHVPDKAALLAAAFFAGSLCLWTQATVGERRTFLLALFAGALLVFQDYLKTSRVSRLLLASFILGIASAIRPNAPIFALAVGLFLALRKRRNPDAPPVPFVLPVVFFVLGFSTSLYLPLRSSLAPFCFLSSGAARFLPWMKELMGLSFLSHLKPVAPVSLTSQFPGFLEAIPDEFGLLGVLAVLYGLVRYFRFKNEFLTFLILILGLDIATWVPFRPFGQGIRHYALFSFFLLVPFLAFGIRGILAHLRTPVLRVAVPAALAVGALLNGWNHLAAANRNDDFSASDYANACLSLSKNAQALFIDYDNEYFPLLPLWYGKSFGPHELIFTGDYESKRGGSWGEAFVDAQKKGDVFLGFRDDELEKKAMLVPEGTLYRVARTPPVLLGRNSSKTPPLAKFAGGIYLNQATIDNVGFFDSRLFALNLTWSRGARGLPNFWVEAFLVGKGGRRLLGLFPPAYGLYPPPRWKLGTKIHEREVFLLPSDVQPGSYEVRIGLLPRSSVKTWPAKTPAASDTLYSEANPFSKRYGGMAGSLARFQEVFSDTGAQSDGFIHPVTGLESTILSRNSLKVAPDSPTFLGGPKRRGKLSVVLDGARANAEMGSN